MSDVSQWDVSAANNNSAPPDGFPEDQAPSTVNNAARELMAAVKRYYDDTGAVNTSGGSSNAYTLAASQGISAYAAGQWFAFVANHANTGAATLSVDSVGAKSIKKRHDQDLVAGDIKEDQIVIVYYQAADDVFELVNPGVFSDSGETISSDQTLVATDSGKILYVDTSSADVTLTLPAEATAGTGWRVFIVKTSASNEVIVNDDAASEVGRVYEDDEIVFVTTDGTAWYFLSLYNNNFASTLFSVYLSSSQQVSSANTWDKIVHDTENYDVGSNFASGTFTAPTAGYYEFHVATSSSGLSDGMQLMQSLYVDSSRVRMLTHTDSPKSSNYMHITGSVQLSLTAGQTVEHYGQIGGASRSFTGGAAETWFSGKRIA